MTTRRIPSRSSAPHAARPWRTVAAGLGFTALVVSGVWQPPRPLVNLEGRVYDLFLRNAAHRPAGTVPVVVDIDEESLARYGQWPWPRYRVAQLLERVRELGAAAVALDVVFAEPDRTSLPLIARELERDLGVVVASGAGRGADNDRRLAEVLEQAPSSSATPSTSVRRARRRTCVLHPLAPGRRSAGTGAPVPAPRARLQPAAARPGRRRLGFFNVAPDADGTVRQLPLLIEHRGEVYPSLALAALMRAPGRHGHLASLPGGRRLSVAGRDPARRPREHARALSRRRAGVPLLSAAAVLEGRVPAARSPGASLSSAPPRPA